MTHHLSQSQARRITLAAQGFSTPRPKVRLDRRHLRKVMQRLQLLQLDSVPALIRTQYMPAFSRLGAYRASLLDDIAYARDEWFEAWAHEASLLPVESEPLLRWLKTRSEAGEVWRSLRRFAKEYPAYIESVYAEIADRGPLTAGELSDPRPIREGTWGRGSFGAVALDWLFRVGRLCVRRRGNFVKVFDLYENVVPEHIRSAPTPSEKDAHRELLLRAARAHGVGSASCLADYFRMPIKESRARLAELAEDGQLQPVRVEGWKQPAFHHPQASLPRRVSAKALVSPFDPLVWNRDRANALFDFDYRIEIYVPQKKRVYGYYVLPFLLGEHLVARVDLRTDRERQVLEVKAAMAEPGVDHERVAVGLSEELEALSTFVGAERYVLGRRGDLMPALRSAKRT